MSFFKYDPLDFLKKQDSYFGAAVRWKLGLATIPDSIPPLQNTNGSWNNSVIDTVINLYKYSLFHTEPVKAVIKALDWLLEHEHEPMQCTNNDGSSYDNLLFKTSRDDNKRIRKIRGLPFGNGCSGFFKTGATLYLTAHFGLLENKRVVGAFETMNKLPSTRNGWYCSPSCGSNLFQAMVKHPIYSTNEQMDLTINFLKREQNEDGSWRRRIPFFPVFNALANLKQKVAKEIFDKALTKTIRSQNSDGSWCRTDKDLKTYLVIDAIDKKKLI